MLGTDGHVVEETIAVEGIEYMIDIQLKIKQSISAMSDPHGSEDIA